jgi:hypothetical protein
MLWHGHAKADLRNRHLHQVALEKLHRHPELLSPVMALLDRWLEQESLRSSRPWLERWRELLTSRPFEQMSEVVLSEEEGQVLRQCSPLGPVLTVQERWKALQDVNRQLRERAAAPL